eukprot:5129304-Pyramimonas_sp.AAC.1
MKFMVGTGSSTLYNVKRAFDEALTPNVQRSAAQVTRSPPDYDSMFQGMLQRPSRVRVRLEAPPCSEAMEIRGGIGWGPTDGAQCGPRRRILSIDPWSWHPFVLVRGGRWTVRSGRVFSCEAV